MLSKSFVSASLEKTTWEKAVPAPYLRRNFCLDTLPQRAVLSVCGLGFYELYINGLRLTAGHLSPYVSNPDQIMIYDRYDIAPYLKTGVNTVAFLLGNGFQNGFDGEIWSFDQAAFCSAPKLAFYMELETDGVKSCFEADENLSCHPSPICRDGLRAGEKYDARLEIPGWNLPDCDLTGWTPAITVPADKGEAVYSCCKPIVSTREIKPVSITREGDAYIYDFGENNTGLTRLNICGTPGQHIVIDHGEWIENGIFTQRNLYFDGAIMGFPSPENPKYIQRTEYICRGDGVETHIPTFTYYGFRYAKVTGITEEQATPELLTFVVMSTKLESRGDFSCSDETLNALQEMTRRATISNFLHFPNDCPHREKNGWTADAALSAEQTMLNFDPEDNYLMWEMCICRAMDERGAVPRIIPTGGWGYTAHNGPAWDSVLVYLPYVCAVLRDDLRCAREAASSMMRYFTYLETRMDEDGLLAIGLGDWCAPKKEYMPSLRYTDSVYAMDMANKAAYLFRRLQQPENAAYCDGFAARMRASIRAHLLTDKAHTIFDNGSQSAQAMAIYYGLCDNQAEKEAAFAELLSQIALHKEHMSTGVLGGRVIFRVLCDFGYQDLAVKMITRPDPPSYGYMVQAGHTTLCEDIVPKCSSFNHHFWGDISALMISYIAGIRINPTFAGADTVAISPVFPTGLRYAQAYHETVKGRIEVRWERCSEKIMLKLTIPEGVRGDIIPPAGYTVDGETTKEAKSGCYYFARKDACV
ncbi:MAG: hypothetical protein E7454_02925 [Ruminococcaceae bacterium]|nr:hypothetical protein [Oscillospiraceae bacterium]